MKIASLLLLFASAVTRLAAKGPFQFSGALESATFDATGVTFTISGKLLIDNYHPGGPPSGPVTLRLSHTRIFAKKFSVLSGPGARWKTQDPASFTGLLAASTQHGHLIQGGASGVSIAFAADGSPETCTIDEISAIDSTLIDTPSASDAPQTPGHG